MHRAISICLLIILALTFVLYGNIFAIALLAALCLLVALNILYNLYIRKRVEIRCRVMGAVRNRKVNVSVGIVNLSGLPIMFLKGKIKVSNTYTGEESAKNFVIPLSPKGENEISPAVEAVSCGKHIISVEKVRLTDVLGMTAIPVKTTEHSNFTVLPELIETNIEYDLRETETFDNEMYSPYKKGPDRSEVFQIREYKEGDALNQIHWKLTGKLDKPIVKDASLPISKSMAIVFDKSDENEVSTHVAEAMAEMLVSTGEFLIEEGTTFQLMWNDSLMKTINTREIQFEEEFAEAIPQLLTGRISKSRENFADIHRLLLGSMTASHIIYICPTNRILADEVVGSGAVTKLIAADPGYRQVCRDLHI